MKKLILLSTILIQSSAFAAGFQLNEYSVTGLGRAFAGAGVMGDDYSAIAYNPAGMSFTERSGVQAGLIGVSLRSDVKGSSTNLMTRQTRTDNTSTKIFRLLPNFFGQYKLNDKATMGVGLYTPFGLATDYKNGWFGETQGQYSAITIVNLTPALSYKVTDKFTLAAGVNLQYATAHLTGPDVAGRYHDIEGDDMGVGYILGATFQPWKSTRLGVSYRSFVRHKLHGENDIKGRMIEKTDVHAKVTTPETVIFSLAQDVNEKWTLSGTARWTRWSRFKSLDIHHENSVGVVSTPERWRDTWFFSAGADYRYCKNLTFRFGTGVDQGTIRDNKYRTVRIPDERRIWASVGATYQKNNWQLDVGYSHLFVRKARAVSNASYTQMDATYHSQSDILGVQFQYKF